VVQVCAGEVSTGVTIAIGILWREARKEEGGRGKGKRRVKKD